MKKKLLVIFLCLAMVLLPLAACTNNSDEKMHVTYADAGWDSIKFHNAVAMYIGEVAYNVEGEEISGQQPSHTAHCWQVSWMCIWKYGQITWQPMMMT